MSQNPRENMDPNVDLSRDDDASNVSPVSTANTHIRIDPADDVHPKRIERLGQYLSDATSGNITEDVKNPGRNFFPISGGTQGVASNTVGEGSSDQIKYTDLIEAAKKEFDELSNATSFDADVFSSQEAGSGHYLLEGGPSVSARSDQREDGAHTYVENQIASGGRWASVGKRTISEDTTNQNPFFSRAIGAQSTLPGASFVGKDNSRTVHSSRNEYTHGGSFGQFDNRADQTFWDSYFKRMSKVGVALTTRATGRDEPVSEDALLRNTFLNTGTTDLGGATLLGLPEEENLQGSWAKKPINKMYAGDALENNAGTGQMTNEEVESAYHTKEMHVRNNESWGSTYSPDDPFPAEGFLLVDNPGVAVLVEMAQVYLFCAVRATAAGLLIAASKALQEGEDRFLFADPEDPQIFNPKQFYKGSSRYNSILGERLYEGYREDRIEKGKAEDFNSLASVLLSGAGNQGAKLFSEEIENISRQLMREIGLYIPRTIVSQVENDQNRPAGTAVAFAYISATVGGLAELGVNILGADFGKSLGFWRAIFKEIARSRSEFVTRSESESAYSSVLKFLGKDDKCTGFMNYLAMLGDKSAADGISGPLTFPIMKVPLDHMPDHPTLRMSKYRMHGSTRSTTSLAATPSMYLIPEWIENPISAQGNRINQITQRHSGEFGAPFRTAKNTGINPKGLSEDELEKIQKKYKSATANNRFTTEEVIQMEDQLEAEYMPFYLQDLRTNEIISFHAFLNTISDSYQGDWSSSKGFGRLEPVQIYGGATRSIGVSFTMVATSQDDFDELWWKANKLVTMIYPQWSRGTIMKNGGNKFVQPFSQVMTASPLARLRVGDLFTSNYSRENMARLMGADDPNFIWNDNALEDGGGEERDYIRVSGLEKMKTTQMKKINDGIKEAIKQAKQANKQFLPITISDFEEDGKNLKVKIFVGEGTEAQLLVAGSYIEITTVNASNARKRTSKEHVIKMNPIFAQNYVRLPEGSANDNTGQQQIEIPSIFTSENPIIKSFESNMGRGIAVAMKSITFDYKTGVFPWEMEAGNRAPRIIEVQLGVEPIHDITPGIDHNGFNRAPVYKVGKYAKSISGDVHHDDITYKNLIGSIEDGHRKSLKGHHGDSE